MVNSQLEACANDAARSGRHREDNRHIVAALEHQSNVTMDDGADLVSAMIFVALERLDDVHPQVRAWAQKLSPAERHKRIAQVIGSMEETTTGVNRLRAMERDGVLKFPVIAVNDAQTKHFFDTAPNELAAKRHERSPPKPGALQLFSLGGVSSLA